MTTAPSSPSPRPRIGSRRRGKKGRAPVAAGYRDWALADFSGYLAADASSDGPCGVLSAVDARRQRRRRYAVLDPDPTQADILLLLARLKAAIVRRGGVVRGLTTDGAPLYPVPIALALGAIPHQVGAFHALKELTQAVRRVRARLGKRRAAAAPKRPRGRPTNTPAAQRLSRRAPALGKRVTELFDERHRFVRHHRGAAQRQARRRLVRGPAQLRALGAIRDAVDRRFDRRCGTAPALAKSARLRQRVRRYRSLGKSLDKLHAPNLEKALTFLDDRLLPATANAVARGNRRHRKMQQTVDSVRTPRALQGRLALDLQRDQQADGRHDTLATLHETRE